MAHNDTSQQWVSTTLGEIVPYGKTQKCVLEDVTDETWVLELEDVEKESSKIVSRKEAKERPFKSTKNCFKEGDVLYGKLRPYLNKVVVADRSGVCSTEIIPLDAEPFVLNRYLFYWLKTRDFLNYVNEVSYGVNMPRLGTKDGVAAPFVLAPLAEQKAIAEKLDTILVRVESAKARLEGIPKILKLFRQSVLAAAVSGKLTEDWRGDNKIDGFEQLSSIRENYPGKSAKDGLAKFGDIPKRWAWALVKEVGVVQLGRQRAPKYHTGNNMRPYLRVANVMEGYIDKESIMEMDFDDQDYEKYKLNDGDILLNEGQSHELVGRPAIYRGEVSGACFTNTLVRFRSHEGVSNEFSFYVFLRNLQSGRFQEIASRTVNISHLGAGRFSDMEFPFPPLEEQTEIVRRVEQLFAYADTIETQVNNALERVNNLTQSILAKAFRGELTEQWRKDNPDLISGENSAEALLDKIKTERAAAKPVKRGRKKA